MKRIALNVKNIREDKGLSQLTLAGIADIHFTYLSQIERGKRKYVSIRIVKQIADALNVTLNDIIENVSKN